MSSLLSYKCPCCGGAIEFDSSLQKMKCPYCDTEFEMEALAAFDDDLKSDKEDEIEWTKGDGTEWQPGEADNIRVYSCKSCGGEVIADQNTAATSCPYCGNPIVMMGQLKGDLRPDYVIPFKLDREAAKRKYAEHLKGKRLLPKIFKDDNHIDEIKGLYVPVWLFDREADADIRYKATKIRSWSDRKYNYTETSYYSVVRGGSMAFAHIPVDGSEKMDDALMESIEPYDFSDAVDFQTAYLAGYLADRFDVDSQQSVERANERVRKSVENAFAGTLSEYTGVTVENSSIRMSDTPAKYALYPVWILNTTWKGQQYIFAMNGQTGKFVGDLPVDKSLARKWLWGVTAAVTAAVFGISYLLWML